MWTVYETPSGALLATVSALLNRVVLESEHLADLLFVETYDDFAVCGGGGGGLGVDLDHHLHGVEVGADVFLNELDRVLYTIHTSSASPHEHGREVKGGRGYFG